MKIRELIEKDPIIVGPDETLQNVAKRMAKEKRDVAVVMEDEIVKGLVAASDIFHAMRSYVLGKNMLESIPMEIRDVRVSELMRAPQALEFMQACGLTGTNMCIVLGENDKVADAVRTMAISGVDHLLIVGDEGVVGTLSDRDLLRAFR